MGRGDIAKKNMVNNKRQSSMAVFSRTTNLLEYKKDILIVYSQLRTQTLMAWY